MSEDSKGNGIKKSIRGILMLAAMFLLASLVHMMIHFSKEMDETSRMIVGQIVVAVGALLTQGFIFYFGKQGGTEDE